MKFTQIAIVALIASVNAEEKKKEEAKKPAAVTCAVTKVEAFSDDKCTKAAAKDKADAVKAAEKTLKDGAAAIKEFKCAGKKMAYCDGTGFGTKTYDDEKCTKAAAKQPAGEGSAWGACIKSGDLYVKLTDATFFKAGAAAAVAMIASQF